MRRPMIAGNWKMNTTVPEALNLINEILPGIEPVPGIDKVICPPGVSLAPLQHLVKDTSIMLGAQNMHFEEKGAFTGEISSLMLIGLCRYVIVGHSERRQIFGENDRLINKKVKAAFIHGLIPIICVGETLEEKEAGRTEEKITAQVKTALQDIPVPGPFVIAYEPVWAIGTGKTASGPEAGQSVSAIRQAVGTVWGPNTADSVQILYGGSTNADNLAAYIGEKEIDGVLAGGASLKPEEFVNMAHQMAGQSK